jgi:hypothetical protein
LVKYVEAIGILTLLLNRFARIQKSVKTVSVGNLFLQALYFFFDGTRRHLCHRRVAAGPGLPAVVEMPEEPMAFSHAIQRFFRAFNIFHARGLPLGVEGVVGLASAGCRNRGWW